LLTGSSEEFHLSKGSRWAFLAAVLSILGWALVGLYFRYSDTWQLVINTATTIITFLMVFLIQNTQNRDARAIHLKFDEIINSIELAHNDMIDIENLSDVELEALRKRFEPSGKPTNSRRTTGPHTIAKFRSDLRREFDREKILPQQPCVGRGRRAFVNPIAGTRRRKCPRPTLSPAED
jgi:low affinity Fe/Cu permease